MQRRPYSVCCPRHAYNYGRYRVFTKGCSKSDNQLLRRHALLQQVKCMLYILQSMSDNVWLRRYDDSASLQRLGEELGNDVLHALVLASGRGVDECRLDAA